MIKSILMSAAIPHQEAQYPNPPAGTFAVYMDSVTADGSDHDICIFEHNCTVELYAPTLTAGNEDRTRLLAELAGRGIHYTTQGWYWLKDIRRYQEVCEFSYFQKYQQEES